MYGLDELSSNCFYDKFFNGLDVQSINVRTCDVRGLHELFVTGLKRLSINFRPRDVKEYGDITSENGLQVLNGINGTLPESAQE